MSSIVGIARYGIIFHGTLFDSTITHGNVMVSNDAINMIKVILLINIASKYKAYL